MASGGKRSWKNERGRPNTKSEPWPRSNNLRRPQEPYMEFLQRMCEEGTLISPKGLVLDLAICELPLSEICHALKIQYAIAQRIGDVKWIDTARGGGGRHSLCVKIPG